MQAQAAIVRRRPLGTTVTAVTAGLMMLLTGGTTLAQALEEIIVTAQKREVGLQDAPLSISAFTGETLEKGRIPGVEPGNAQVKQDILDFNVEVGKY